MTKFLRTRGDDRSTAVTRRLMMAALALAAFAVSACSSERVAGPSMEPVQSNVLSTTTNTLSTTTSTLKTTLTRVTALRWSQPASEVTATATIGSNGGTISAGGITLTVPRGAVSKSTQFRVTRVAGNVVAYEFEPHGARFAKPLTITQSTAGTNFRSMPATLVRGAYFTDRSLIDQLLGTVLVAEFRTATVSSDRATVRFTVDHFSGYMVSMD